MTKLRVWLCQINNTFGRSAFLPYSVGLLQAYALKDDVIREHYEFCGFVFLREDITECVKRMGEVDVFAASLYIWNHNFTAALAKVVKEANPSCLVILGGPHVPIRSEGFFEKHPWADILIHYEGEETFREVLKAHLCEVEKRRWGEDGYWWGRGGSLGTSVRKNDLSTHKNPDRPRMTDLDQIPSPYLTGLFDNLMGLDYDFHATQETHRGCLTAGTEVITMSGKKPIEAVLPRDKVLGWDEDKQKPVWNTISESICTGLLPTLKITVGDVCVKATHDHPIYTKEGWKRADEIQEGDEVLRSLWQLRCGETEQDVFLCLRTDTSGPENQGAKQEKSSYDPPASLQDVREGISQRKIQTKDMLSRVRFGGEESVAGTKAEDDIGEVLQGLWEATQAEIQTRLRGQDFSQDLFGEMLPIGYQSRKERRAQPRQTARSPRENIRDGREDVGGIVSPHDRDTPSWENQLLSSEGNTTEQVREAGHQFHGPFRLAVSIRGMRRLLGGAVPIRNVQKPRLRAYGQQDKESGVGARNVLASEREPSSNRIGRLHEEGLEGVCDLGEHGIRGGIGKRHRKVRWETVTRIESDGVQKVYDLVNARPYPNFFADQILVHNCPYSCAFCDWGSNTLAKVKSFSTERLTDEFLWMAKHKVDLLYNADANYGLLARDMELTENMVSVKRQHGFPNKFRAAYAKNSNEKVFQISKLLNEAGMSKGTTLSFQSMDNKTLKIVKRKNIEVKDFKSLMSRYREHGIPTYSEIIVGLPGETYDSFSNGLNTLLEAGQHESINIYTCVAEGTMIDTSRGPLPVEKVQNGDWVLSWDEECAVLDSGQVGKVVCNGISKTLRIECAKNHVEVTHDHPIYTKEGWKRADQLRIGDKVLFNVRWGDQEVKTEEGSVLFNAVLEERNGNERCAEEGTSEKRPESCREEKAIHCRDEQKEMSDLWRPFVQCDGGETEQVDNIDEEDSLLLGVMLGKVGGTNEGRKDSSSGRELRQTHGEYTYNSREGRLEYQSSELPRDRGAEEGQIREVDGEVQQRPRVGNGASTEGGGQTQQLRESSHNLSGENEVPISIYRRFPFLGKTKGEKSKQEPRFHLHQEGGEKSDSSTRSLLASRSVRGSERIEILRGSRLGVFYHLGRREIGRQDGGEDQTVRWEVITSIQESGQQKVYDLLGVSPYNNFFANGILVHNCEVLPNSEMNHPEYREKHGIKSVITPQLFYHATPVTDHYREEYELVVETKTLPPEDWMRCEMFAWGVQCFHCMGLTRLVAIFMRHYTGMSYRTFYEKWLNFIGNSERGGALFNSSVVWSLCNIAARFYKEMRQGRTPELIDLRFGNITWPPEEFTYLLACASHKAFYNEVMEFVISLGVVESTAVDMTYLQSRRCIPPPDDNEEEWAKQEVWYGRKGKTTLTDELLQQVITLAEDRKKEDMI